MYAKWYDGPITPGLAVYVGGFPLGDPEFTLTRGIVSKERASGETSWALVDAVIEHNATINPGNSGGPLVTQDGKRVGINYASDPRFDSQNTNCTLQADAIYYWYTHDSSWGTCAQIWPK
jgi:hypothetical protein